MTTTLSYVPSRGALWRRVLVRAFWFPRKRWARLLVGPLLVVLGVGLVSGATPSQVTPLGSFGGMLAGIGLGWTLWPVLGAALAVAVSARVRRQRAPIRLTVDGGVLELVRGEERTLYALADLVRVERLGGEHWLHFRGDRWVVVPGAAAEGDPKRLLEAVVRAA